MERCDIEEEARRKEAAKFTKEDYEEVHAWIKAVANLEDDPEFAPEPDEKLTTLRNGVVLCKLMNAIVPNSIPRFCAAPKHHMEERENIQRFLAAAPVLLHIDTGEMFTIDDLHSAKAIPNVLKTIYAIGRQVQVLPGFTGPKLGVTFVKSLEYQRMLKEKKEQEQQAMAYRAAIREQELQERVSNATMVQLKEKLDEEKEREMKNLERRKGKSRISNAEYDDLVKEIHHKYKELEAQGVGADIQFTVKFGMDRDLDLKLKRKAQASSGTDEEEIIEWLEKISGEQIDDLYEDLKRGDILFKIIEVTWGPKYVPKKEQPRLKSAPMKAAAERANIKKYIEFCGQFGFRQHLFGIEDLYTGKDKIAVLNHLIAMKRKYDTVTKFQAAKSPLSPSPVSVAITPAASTTSPKPIADWDIFASRFIPLTVVLYLAGFCNIFLNYSMLWSINGVEPIALLIGQHFNVQPFFVDVGVAFLCLTGTLASIGYFFTKASNVKIYLLALLWVLYGLASLGLQSYRLGFDVLLLEVGAIALLRSALNLQTIDTNNFIYYLYRWIMASYAFSFALEAVLNGSLYWQLEDSENVNTFTRVMMLSSTSLIANKVLATYRVLVYVLTSIGFLHPSSRISSSFAVLMLSTQLLSVITTGNLSLKSLLLIAVSYALCRDVKVSTCIKFSAALIVLCIPVCIGISFISLLPMPVFLPSKEIVQLASIIFTLLWIGAAVYYGCSRRASAQNISKTRRIADIITLFIGLCIFIAVSWAYFQSIQNNNPFVLSDNQHFCVMSIESANAEPLWVDTPLFIFNTRRAAWKLFQSCQNPDINHLEKLLRAAVPQSYSYAQLAKRISSTTEHQLLVYNIKPTGASRTMVEYLSMMAFELVRSAEVAIPTIFHHVVVYASGVLRHVPGYTASLYNCIVNYTSVVYHHVVVYTSLLFDHIAVYAPAAYHHIADYTSVISNHIAVYAAAAYHHIAVYTSAALRYIADNAGPFIENTLSFLYEHASTAASKVWDAIKNIPNKDTL